MTKHLKKSITVFIIAVMMVLSSIPFASATSLIQLDKPVGLNLSCDKAGYGFEVFQIASVENKEESPYETSYKPLFNDIADEVKSGKTKDILAKMDSFTTIPDGAVSVGTFDSSEQSKKISNLEQGIYYIKCTKYPAGVKSVTNSVAALPYFDGSDWIYTVPVINLASKVADDVPTTEKIITNSTKNNNNYTDVNLGDRVDFELINATAGSASIKLNTYTVYDDMSAGLTLNKNSFNVYLADASKNKLSKIAASNYDVNVTSEADGQNTKFNVALKPSYLAQNAFYESNVKYVLVDYSAVLNKHAVKGAVGNPNEDVELKYGNTSTVDSVPGNTVYVYTYGITANKLNEEAQALAGAKFSMYKTRYDLAQKQNAIATGTSDESGKVIFKNAEGTELSLQSGTYYVIETEAPQGYQIYGKVMEINIDVEYSESIANSTWVKNAPENGVATFTVTDTKLVVPQTGGYVQYVYLAGIAFVVLGAAMCFAAFKLRKNTSK